MAGNLIWHGDELRRRLEAEIGRRLDAAAIAVEGHAKKLISVDGTAKVGTGKRAKLKYNANPSRPGEPPHVQTGRLRASVAHERDGLVARVGTNVRYGAHLELGTAHISPRPWLRRALIEMTPALNAIVGRPFKMPGR